MQVLTDPNQAAAWSAGVRRAGRTIGFVPTMGALHAGHKSLIDRAVGDGHATVSSIFVNPLQFNSADDLARYPRQLEKDLELLVATGCEMVFTPSADRLYQTFRPRQYDIGELDQVLEGPLRPGHFQGVVNVVERLFHYVRPDVAYFGEKDRQQLAVIQYVARQQRWPERIIGCPTLREADGLAMSSRNQRLSAGERTVATRLYRALRAVETGLAAGDPGNALAAGRAVLAAEPSIRTEYLALADPISLRPVEAWNDRTELVALVAAWVGSVRLIDNISVRR